MAGDLTALVVGAGNAGRGQIAALEYAGVEVVGLASRTARAAARVARELDVPHASADWKRLLRDLKPSIVGIATPGDTHALIARAAIDAGAHVFCERPLAISATDAADLVRHARSAGVKTCFCAPALFQPQVLFVRDLIAGGAIGPLREVELVSHFHWPRFAPFGWQHRLASGGGRLNHHFANTFAAIGSILGKPVTRVIGATRNDWRRVPRFDSRFAWDEFYQRDPTDEELAEFDWVEVDVDSGYTVNAEFGDATGGPADRVSVLFRHSVLANSWPNDFAAFYGDSGTIHVQGAALQGAVLTYSGGPTWEERAIPLEIHDALPLEDNNDRRNWMTLMAQFAADIRGDAEFSPYPAFEQGAEIQSIIEAVRAGVVWEPHTS
jgi:predicted dehydrogenase